MVGDAAPLSRRRAAAQYHPSDDSRSSKNNEDAPRKNLRGSPTRRRKRRRMSHLLCLAFTLRWWDRRQRRANVLIGLEALSLCLAILLISDAMGGTGCGGLSPLCWRPRGAKAIQARPREASFAEGADRHFAVRSMTDRDVRLSILGRNGFGTSYGKLKFRKLAPGDSRVIGLPDPADGESEEVLPLGHPPLFHDYQGFAPFDDDWVRSAVFRLRNKETHKCQRAPWHNLHNPTCNDFHTMDLLGGLMSADVAYIGYGYYRQTFMLKGASSGEGSAVADAALKMLRWRPDQDDFTVNRMEQTRVDALVMERLTSSPRITNVHGHCAFSIATESLPGEVMDYVVPTEPVIEAEELHDEDGVDNKNGMSPAEKLDLALTVAEGLAELHGFEDGLIVHDDIYLDQFLRTPSGQLKLNDFNRARLMQWDSDEEIYCKYYNGYIEGKDRSPEEYTDPPGNLNEKVDVFDMGDMFYGILTGLHPFYFTYIKEAKRRLVKGERPFIDERWRKHSFAERKIIEAMERCWIHDPDERVDVFWVVRFLREAVGENVNHLLDETNMQALARDARIPRHD